MKLAPVGAEAAETLAALHAQAFDPSWPAAQMASLAQGAGTIALLAEDESGPVGMILCRALFEAAEILTLAVAPAARRRGIGAALVRAAAGLAAQGGADNLFLEVAQDNPAAQALYRSLGFAEAGRRAGYYARAERRIDALVMRLDLNTRKA
ncbi:MAG: ribosomal protein S18-alanine N-acetyltransferase [Phenylobacterium sp.]|uniref:ribosomal protein S18-alanine N-acetyltransferase n=1 Tax=Phenylobacterium sp. TaxID=1871053 RepID=UPI0017964C6B|nr:ribosomal protein S18-alanine N-acetyltransferase [Phenylobacterium sp.]MBA4794767.1 ribosomal protein S18-alanine N-acetyltransferase [Phenylobacterium sp.]